MRRTPSGVGIFMAIAIVLIIEYYSYIAFRSVVNSLNIPQYTKLLTGIYVTLSAFTLASFFVMPNLDLADWNPLRRNIFLIFIFSVFVGQLIAATFMALNDIVGLIVAAIQYVAGNNPAVEGGPFYTRSEFFTRAAGVMGLVGFVAILSGVKNKYNYKVRTVNIDLGDIPQQLRNLRIVQISDIHSGSFDDKTDVQHGVDIINDLKPDLILFTGDLVNNHSPEILPYIDNFKQLKAKYGVYSILGNHDYGNYYHWDSEEAKHEDFEKFISYQKDKLGWNLLRNENRELDIDGAKLSLIGVENWSKSNSFPKYGDLKKAMEGVDPDSLHILMSHDPSHWDAQVHNYPSILLTLSGHTHGMQFGIEIPGFIKWSPAQYIYKQWAGLYKKGHQYIYVNRGFGFLGYPGRVGILPEITVINLV